VTQVERFRTSAATSDAEPLKGSKRSEQNYFKKNMKAKKSQGLPKKLKKMSSNKRTPSLKEMTKWAKTKKAQRWAGFSV